MICLTADGPFHFFWTNAVGERAGQFGHNTANNPAHQGAPSRLTWVTAHAEAVLHTTSGSKHVVCRFIHVWHAWQPTLSGHHGCLWLGPLRAFGAADISWSLPPTVENIACNNHQGAGNHTKTNGRTGAVGAQLLTFDAGEGSQQLEILAEPLQQQLRPEVVVEPNFPQFRQGSSQHQSQMLITSNDQEKRVIHPASCARASRNKVDKTKFRSRPKLQKIWNTPRLEPNQDECVEHVRWSRRFNNIWW